MSSGAKEESTRRDRRDLLASAAFEFFDSVPFDQVTVDAVAERAGVARGLVAYYFGSKEGLYRAAREQFDELRRERQRRNPHSEPVPWLQEDVSTFLHLMEEHPIAMHNTMRSPYREKPDSTPVSSAMSSFTLTRIMHVLTPAVDDPLLHTVIASWGVHCIELALRWLEDRPRLQRQDIAAVMVAELRAGVSAVAHLHPEFNVPRSFLL